MENRQSVQSLTSVQIDINARNRMLEDALPALLRFARAKLPACVRRTMDARDVVHDVILRVLPNFDASSFADPAGLQAFLRKAIANQIIDEVRRAGRRSGSPDPLDSLADASPSVLTQLLVQENRQRVRAALAQLSRDDRALIVQRFECEQKYADVARILNRTSANATRVAVKRAVRRIADTVERQGTSGHTPHAVRSVTRGGM